MKKTKLTRTAATMMTLALCLTGLVSKGFAEGGKATAKTQAKKCKLSTLEGSFSFTTNGVITASPIPTIPNGPYSAIGLVTFNSDGTLTLSTTQSFNGNIVPPTTFTGLYTVDEDCTGAVQTSGGGTYNLIILDRGREFHFIQTNTGAAITGVAKRQ